MLWDKWIPEKFLVKPEVCSLELCFTDEKKQYFHAFLKQNGKKLELLETGSSEEILSLPPRVLKMKIPVILILNGKGIILKKIDLDPEQEKDIEVILKQNLPSVHQDDFYVQIYKQADHSAFIAVCRKEQLDSVLDELKTRKYDLAGVL